MNREKIMLRYFASLALAGLIAASLITTNSEPAEARSRVGVGIAAGVLVGTVLGAYAYGAPRYYGSTYYSYSSEPACYKGPRQCDWAGRSCYVNHWGERVCHGGERRCWRPTICD
jgi:hypothetical protein